MVQKNIPLVACEKLLKQAGARRIADDALVVLQKELEQEIRRVTHKASQFSKHAKRKTILSQDVELSLE